MSCMVLRPVTVGAADQVRLIRSRLASYDWLTTSSRNLATDPPAKKVVEEFVRLFEISVRGESYLGDGEDVCSFCFADLRHDGVLSLVYGIGVTNRPSCRDVYIIYRTSFGFEGYWISGGLGAGSNVASHIKDLQKDGKLEFLLDNSAGYIRGECFASWIAVFAWSGRNYTNVSDQFKNFYRQKLDALRQLIPTLQPPTGSGGLSLRSKECLEAQAADIQRFLGVSSNAGIEQALRLASSKNPAERFFAAQILGQIGTPEARPHLERLTEDSDSDVANFAKGALSALSGRPPALAPSEFVRLHVEN